MQTKEFVDPISMLKEDHSKVKKLFDQFENSDDKRTQMQLAKQAIQELKIHAAIEEEIFYPGVKKAVDDEEVMAEAVEEHHVVHFLIKELESQKLDSKVFHAKFIVLAENVRHHIKEEEGEMMPKIKVDESELQDLASRMTERKEELMKNPDSLDTRGRKSSIRQSTAKARSNGGKNGRRRSRSSAKRAA
jgi:hypothetical protein